MNTTEKFVKFCQRIVKEQAEGKLSIIDAAAKIRDNDKLKPGAHPMLRNNVSYLAWDIAEDYQGAEAHTKMWQELTDTVNRYASGDWTDSNWLFIASYAQRDGGKVVHGAGVSIKRHNGKTTVSAGDKILGDAYKKVVSTINKFQTDEWYLRNIAYKVLTKIGTYELEEARVSDGSGR